MSHVRILNDFDSGHRSWRPAPVRGRCDPTCMRNTLCTIVQMLENARQTVRTEVGSGQVCKELSGDSSSLFNLG